MSEVKSYQQMRKEFQDRYFNKISPGLKYYEDERKQKRILAILAFIILLILGILVICLAIKISSDGHKSDGVFKLGALVIFLAFFVPHMIKKNFEKTIKKSIMPIVCKCFGDNFIWTPDYIANYEEYKISNLVSNFNRESFDDIFKGSYKNIPIEIVECNLSYKAGKNETTVFNGAVVKLKMNKNFKGNTVIRPDSIFHVAPNGLKHTELEDINFEKKFDVFTDDEVEARYLITPSFMTRLNSMQRVFRADKVSCAFYEDSIYIGLHTNKDLFSICDLSKPVDDGKQFFTMFEEILSIIKLIDHFKLDQKIGL